MNEKINIIKTEKSVIVQNLTEKKEYKPSKNSFCISKNRMNNIIVSSVDNFKYVTSFENVTIQPGATGIPEQLTPENWDALTDGINDQTGGGAAAGVSKIIAGDNITVTPDSGDGNVTISASGEISETPKLIQLTNNTATVNYEITPLKDYVFISNGNNGGSIPLQITDTVDAKNSTLKKLYQLKLSTIEVVIPPNTYFKAFWTGSVWQLSSTSGLEIETSLTNNASSIPTSRAVYGAIEDLEIANGSGQLFVREIPLLSMNWMDLGAGTYEYTVLDPDITDSRIVIFHPIFNNGMEGDLWKNLNISMRPMQESGSFRLVACSDQYSPIGQPDMFIWYWFTGMPS